jgi:lysophospholipase L1-like esterase
MRKYRWHAAVLVLLLLLVGGALFIAGDDDSQPGPRPGPPENVPRVLVGLGDSTMSGEGAGDYEPGTNGEQDNWCHRSRAASIHQTSLPGIAATISLACSGANSAQVGLGEAKQYSEPSQAGRLSVIAGSNRVVAVVVAVGANDDPSFANSLNGCVEAWFNQGAPPCSQALGKDWRRRIDAMTPKVTKVLQDIRKVMAGAGYGDSDYQLVLQSYSAPIAPNVAQGLQDLSGCPFRTEDLRWVREVAVPTLTEGIRRAAADGGARFLDLSRSGTGREACSSADPGKEWFRRLAVQWTDLQASQRATHALQESFHPNAAGYAQIGRCLSEFLSTNDRAAACLPGTDGDLHAAASVR